MDAILLGSAGWTPTDTRETACVYLREGDQVILLDGGTGVRRLLTSPELARGVARVDVLLSHFHLDHIVGLSYLPGLNSGVERRVWGPGRELYGTPTATLLERLVSAPLFALELADTVEVVEELPIGAVEIGPFTLTTRAQERHTHPSVGYRLGDDLAYCTDTGYDPGTAEFARGCRHLLHEAFWMDEAADNTHSTAAEAARLAAAANTDRLTLVHLNPRLTDEKVFLEPALELFPSTCLGQDLVSL